VDRPLARFTPSGIYVSLTLFSVCGTLFSSWTALRWTPAWIAAALFAISASILAAITLRPAIEIYEAHLAVGRRKIPWRDVRRIDQTGWITPLAVRLTLRDHPPILLLYPGDPDSSNSLLRHLRRFSRQALLDGVTYREFWGELSNAETPPESPAESPAPKDEAAAPARYPMLRTEDEEEVERLFQRLKSVGHLESKSSDEK